MNLKIRRCFFILKQIVLYFGIAALSGFFIWVAPQGIARYHSNLNPSSDYRAGPAFIVACLIFFLGVLSFLISYFLFTARNPKAEMDSQTMFDIQIAHLNNVSAWSKRHIDKIIAGIILFAFLVVLADALLN